MQIIISIIVGLVALAGLIGAGWLVDHVLSPPDLRRRARIPPGEDSSGRDW